MEAAIHLHRSSILAQRRNTLPTMQDQPSAMRSGLPVSDQESQFRRFQEQLERQELEILQMASLEHDKACRGQGVGLTLSMRKHPS